MRYLLTILMLLLLLVNYFVERYRYRSDRIWEDARTMGRFLTWTGYLFFQLFLRTGLWGVALQMVWIFLALALPPKEKALFAGGAVLALLILIRFGEQLLFHPSSTPWAMVDITLYISTLAVVWMVVVRLVYPADLSLLIFLPGGALFATGLYLVGAPGWEAVYRSLRSTTV